MAIWSVRGQLVFADRKPAPCAILRGESLKDMVWDDVIYYLADNFELLTGTLPSDEKTQAIAWRRLNINRHAKQFLLQLRRELEDAIYRISPEVEEDGNNPVIW